MALSWRFFAAQATPSKREMGELEMKWRIMLIVQSLIGQFGIPFSWMIEPMHRL